MLLDDSLTLDDELLTAEDDELRIVEDDDLTELLDLESLDSSLELRMTLLEDEEETAELDEDFSTL